MRHFDQLGRRVRARRVPPSAATVRPGQRRLGARPRARCHPVRPGHQGPLTATVRRQAAAALRSMVIDLEDAIPDDSVDSALTSHRRSRCGTCTRIRRSAWCSSGSGSRNRSGADRLSSGRRSGVVSGFVLPKFTVAGGAGLSAGGRRCGREVGEPDLRDAGDRNGAGAVPGEPGRRTERHPGAAATARPTRAGDPDRGDGPVRPVRHPPGSRPVHLRRRHRGGPDRPGRQPPGSRSTGPGSR